MCLCFPKTIRSTYAVHYIGIVENTAYPHIVCYISFPQHVIYIYMSQVTELWLSCYLVLLSIDSKTRWQDSRSSVTWPIFLLWADCRFVVCQHAFKYDSLMFNSGIYVLNIVLQIDWSHVTSTKNVGPCVHGMNTPHMTNKCIVLIAHWSFIQFYKSDLGTGA